MESLWAGYALFIVTLFIVTVLFSFYLYVIKKHGVKNSLRVTNQRLNEFSPAVKFLLLVTVFLVIIGFWMPFFLTRDAFIVGLDFTRTGAIGDTFGGILNPFVALAAVMVTGLAFYMQYQANQQIQNQFNLQKIESQFYEMLKLHKENVQEIELSKEDNSKIICKGRQAFTFFKNEFEMFLEMLEKSEEEFDDIRFNSLYHLFFTGISEELMENVKKHSPLFYQRFQDSLVNVYALGLPYLFCNTEATLNKWH